MDNNTIWAAIGIVYVIGLVGIGMLVPALLLVAIASTFDDLPDD